MTHAATDPYTPPDALDREETLLAPYAMRTRQSRGRRHGEPEHPYRTAYQRDRDRIVHSAAFRRLMYKTQVLVNDYSDEHRTRMTHTLEVAQISRTIARQLGLNEDLTEAIALAHDLGHPPFGHAGEYALDACMANHGGYEHNRFGLRLVEQLETRYPGFPGLNLTWEVRESMAFHSKRPESPEVREYLGGTGRNACATSTGGGTDISVCATSTGGGGTGISACAGQPFLEAQVVDAADSLAYDCHDLDDALSVGLIALEAAREVEIVRRALERIAERFGAVSQESLRPTLVRTLIDWQVNDLVQQTQERIRAHRVRSVENVRRAPELLAVEGGEMQSLKKGLEDFLHKRVYRHHRVARMTNKAGRIVRTLFEEFRRTPAALPDVHARRIPQWGLEQTICDYLASMTDRSAQEEYGELVGP
jgi:dGTPase